MPRVDHLLVVAGRAERQPEVGVKQPEERQAEQQRHDPKDGHAAQVRVAM